MRATGSNSHIRIRQAEQKDVEGLGQLRYDFFQTQIDAGLLDIPSDLTGMLAVTTPMLMRSKRQFCLIAECDGRAEGYAVAVVRMIPDMALAAVGSIEEIYVSDALQRSGIGGRLVAEALDALRRAGAERVQTRVLANNRSAREFWRRAGFFENVHILELGTG
jgi:GNAT superfamily N-acetyltransferase